MSNTYKDDPAKGLGYLQKEILLFLVDEENLASTGASWNPTSWTWVFSPEGLTRAEVACFSRALARLEQRGLIIRQNWHKRIRETITDPFSGRTTHVVLTELGYEIASQIDENS